MAKVVKYIQESFLDDLVGQGDTPATAGTPGLEPTPAAGVATLTPPVLKPVNLDVPADALPGAELSIGGLIKAKRLNVTPLKGSRKKLSAHSIPEAQSISHIAQVLRLRPQYLEAIEADQFDLLPGPAYAKGFIRAYAQYLGLDADLLVERYRCQLGDERQYCRLNFPEPVEKRNAPKWAVAAAILLLVCGTYGIWLGVSRDASPVTAMAGMEVAANGKVKPLVAVKAPMAVAVAGQNVAPVQSAKPVDAPSSIKSNPIPVSEPAPLRVIPTVDKPSVGVTPLRPLGHSYFRQISLDNGPFATNDKSAVDTLRHPAEKNRAAIINTVLTGVEITHAKRLSLQDDTPIEIQALPAP